MGAEGSGSGTGAEGSGAGTGAESGEPVDRAYAPLADAGGALLETLTAYLAHGGSLEACARSLYVHANTVRYRLRRVAEVSGWTPSAPRERFVLQTALALGRLSQGGAPSRTEPTAGAR